LANSTNADYLSGRVYILIRIWALDEDVELLLEDRKVLYEGAEFIFGNLGSRDEPVEMRGNIVDGASF